MKNSILKEFEKILSIDSLLSGVLGSIIVFILGVIYQGRKDRKDRRIDNRSYIALDYLDGVGINSGVGDALEVHSTEKRFRIIKTKDYDKLVQLKNPMNFIAIKNIGPNVILDFHIDIKIIFEDGETSYIKTKIPLVENKEDIYICTDSLRKKSTSYYVKNVEVMYKTLVGEKIKFVYNRDKDKENNIITTNKIYICMWRMKEVSSIDIPNCSWIYHSK